MRTLFLLTLAITCALAATASEPDDLYKQGLAKLKVAQDDHAALVPAVKLLAKAAALYAEAGQDTESAEANSCLYWAKKKMVLADTEAIKSDLAVTKQIETATKPVTADQAQGMMLQADMFANGHADEPLLVAIRYFEVADRFKDSDVGRTAMDKSLKAMQAVGAKAKLVEYKPQPTDGKVFVKSEPAGAAIILVTADGGKMDTGKKTPTMVQLPVGRQTLELQLKAYKPGSMTVAGGRGTQTPSGHVAGSWGTF